MNIVMYNIESHSLTITSTTWLNNVPHWYTNCKCTDKKALDEVQWGILKVAYALRAFFFFMILHVLHFSSSIIRFLSSFLIRSLSTLFFSPFYVCTQRRNVTILLHDDADFTNFTCSFFFMHFIALIQWRCPVSLNFFFLMYHRLIQFFPDLLHTINKWLIMMPYFFFDTSNFTFHCALRFFFNITYDSHTCKMRTTINVTHVVCASFS